MQVDFQTVDDFLAEIASEQSEFIDGQIVRCEVTQQPRNGALFDVYLRAGFMSGGELRQLVLECGQNPAPRNETPGLEVAHQIEQRIRDAVVEKQLEFRRGAFVG